MTRSLVTGIQQSVGPNEYIKVVLIVSMLIFYVDMKFIIYEYIRFSNYDCRTTVSINALCMISDMHSCDECFGFF